MKLEYYVVINHIANEQFIFNVYIRYNLLIVKKHIFI